MPVSQTDVQMATATQLAGHVPDPGFSRTVQDFIGSVGCGAHSKPLEAGFLAAACDIWQLEASWRQSISGKWPALLALFSHKTLSE